MKRFVVTPPSKAHVGSKRLRVEDAKGPVQVVSLEEQNKNLAITFRSPDVGAAGNDSEGEVSTNQGSQEAIIPIEESRCATDPIYGSMSFPECAWRIIHTPEFQRLAELNQLGASRFAFPSATHTRAAHSLGVGHLASRFVEEIMKKQPCLGLDRRDHLCLIIAGLCHDLGHGPFSHLFDEEFMRKEDPSFCHEKWSVKMLDHLLEENNIDLKKEAGLEEIDLVFIKEIILGEKLEGGVEARKGRGRRKAFLYEIVNNTRCGFDVDKLDYLKRDTHASGYKADLFCVERLLHEVRVGQDKDGVTTLCFRENIYPQVMDVFKQRVKLHLEVYQNANVKAPEFMIRDVLRLANDHLDLYNDKGERFTMKTAVKDMSVYAQLTDSVLACIASCRKPEMQPAKDLLKRLKRNDLYIPVSEKGSLAESFDFRTQKESAERQLTQRLLNVLKNKQITKDDFMVEVFSLHCGKGKENPLTNMCFVVGKGEKLFVRPVQTEKYQGEIPTHFGTNYVRCFAKKPEFAKELADAWTEVLRPVATTSPRASQNHQMKDKAEEVLDNEHAENSLDAIAEEGME